MLNLFRRKHDTLDTIHLDLQMLCSHLMIIAGSGGGKTSILGRLLTDTLKRGGDTIGGVFAAVKPGEVAFLKQIFEAAGQSHRFLHLGSNLGIYYNFIQHDLKYGSPRVLVKRLLTLSRMLTGASDKGEEAYWAQQFEKCLLMAVIIGHYALREKFHVEYLYRIIISSAASHQQLANEKFRENSFCLQMIKQAGKRITSESESREYQQATAYFMSELVSLGDRTRGTIVGNSTAVLSGFLSPELYDIVVCEESNVSPIDAASGSLVALDFPIMSHGDGGRFIQSLFINQAVDFALGRDIPTHTMLVYMDEYPVLVSGSDTTKLCLDLATARSQRVAYVAGLQNLPLLVQALGGASGENAMKSLLGNFATILVGSNQCAYTNKYWSDAFGNSLQQFTSVSEQKRDEELSLYNMMLGNDDLVFSCSSQFSPRIQPSDFIHLRRGSDAEKRYIDFYLTQAGLTFGADGSPVALRTIRRKRS